MPSTTFFNDFYSPLTVSLAPLFSQFCWTALVLSPFLSSAQVELCPQHHPSSHHHNHPWTPRPQRNPSQSWRTNCCSLNQTPRLKKIFKEPETGNTKKAVFKSITKQKGRHVIREILILIYLTFVYEMCHKQLL